MCGFICLFFALQHSRIKVKFKLSCKAVTMWNLRIFIDPGEGKYALRIMSEEICCQVKLNKAPLCLNSQQLNSFLHLNATQLALLNVRWVCFINSLNMNSNCCPWNFYQGAWNSDWIFIKACALFSFTNMLQISYSKTDHNAIKESINLEGSNWLSVIYIQCFKFGTYNFWIKFYE